MNVQKILTTNLLVLLLAASLSAQPTKVLRVKNGKDATKTLSAADRFEYKEFQFGKLVYKNGNYAQSRLNYCYLLGELMYINLRGDTLLIADNNAVNYAEIGKDIFTRMPEMVIWLFWKIVVLCS